MSVGHVLACAEHTKRLHYRYCILLTHASSAACHSIFLHQFLGINFFFPVSYSTCNSTAHDWLESGTSALGGVDILAVVPTFQLPSKWAHLFNYFWYIERPRKRCSKSAWFVSYLQWCTRETVMMKLFSTRLVPSFSMIVVLGRECISNMSRISWRWEIRN